MIRTLSAFELPGLGLRVDDGTRKEGFTAVQVAEMSVGGNNDRRNGNMKGNDKEGCGGGDDDDDDEWLELFRGLIGKLRAGEGTQSPS